MFASSAHVKTKEHECFACCCSGVAVQGCRVIEHKWQSVHSLASCLMEQISSCQTVHPALADLVLADIALALILWGVVLADDPEHRDKKSTSNKHCCTVQTDPCCFVSADVIHHRIAACRCDLHIWKFSVRPTLALACKPLRLSGSTVKLLVLCCIVNEALDFYDDIVHNTML